MTATSLGNPVRVIRHLRLPLRIRLAPRRRMLATTPPWWRELLLVGCLYAAYELGRALERTDLLTALANGRAILNWERSWHLSPELVLNHALSHMTVLEVAASYFYSTLHYVITPAVLVWMYRRHSGHYRFARTSLVISTILGLVGFYLLPTAPPRLLSGSGLRDILADVDKWGWWGNDGSVPRGMGELSNQFAAMPSLHVGWALWAGVLLAIYASRWWVRALGALYPIATTVVVLATGNHYLVDTIAGAVTIGIGTAITAVVWRQRVVIAVRHLLKSEQPDDDAYAGGPGESSEAALN